MMNSFFKPTVAAPSCSTGFRAAESFLVALAATAAFGSTCAAHYFTIFEIGVLGSRDGNMPLMQALVQTLPYTVFVGAAFSLLLVLLQGLWWLGIAVATFAVASVPALQRRPRVLRTIAIAIVGASAVAGFFATLHGGPGGAFIG